MSDIQLSSSYPADLVPIAGKILTERPPARDTELEQLFKQEQMKFAIERRIMRTPMGVAEEKLETENRIFKSHKQAWEKLFKVKTIALAFQVSMEAMEDGTALDQVKVGASDMKRAFAQTKKIKFASVFNNAFDSAYKGGDNVELCGAHTASGTGETVRNELSVAADLSETSLEQCIIDIEDLVDEGGYPALVQPRDLVVPNELHNDAIRIVKTLDRPGTGNNDTNAIRMRGVINDIIASTYLTDSNAFFITTDADNGLVFLTKRGLKMDNDVKFENLNHMYGATERYADPSWVSYLSVFGSPGA